MISAESQSIIQRAKALYESRLREEMERTHFGEFICIEPETGEYFLGHSFDEAVDKAIDAIPDRLTFTLRIGHAAALHMGAFGL